MHIRVDRSQIWTELNYLQGVAPTKQIATGLSHVLIEAMFGKIRLRATDLDLTITAECQADILKHGSICVPVRKLTDVIRSLPKAEIDIKTDDKFQATITCNSSRFKLNGMNPSDFPEPETYSGLFAEIPAEVFSYFIHHVIQAAGRQESRYALNCAKLEISKGHIRMVATDGHRLAMIEREGEFNEPIEALIPRKTLTELAKLCASSDEALQIGKTDNKIHFKLGAREMVSQLAAGVYPDYTKVLPKENHNRFTVERNPTLAAIRRVALAADEHLPVIKLEIRNGEMRISSNSREMWEAGETIPINYSGEAITTGFNATYLSDFFSAANKEELSFEFKDGYSPAQLRCKPSSQCDWIGVVMPIRVSDR